MQYRLLGRTGLQVSELGFGCGAVGGLLVRGDYPEMVRTVARAIEAGITYFDTARMYGNGQSETNLGRVLEELQANVIVGTKVQLANAELDTIEAAIVASVEGSLRRLRREQVDLFQLHNPLSLQRQPGREWVAITDYAPIMETFQKLQAQGKIRFWGINGLGETAALHQAIDTGQAYTIQSCYNLLNPTAGTSAPAKFPFQDYAQLIDRAAEQQMGVIAIRVLAAGALSGSATRHPLAAQAVAPITSGQDLAEDAALAQAFHFLVAEGYADNLVEAAIRFAISNKAISTALVGISSLAQLEQALASVEKGPLSVDALAHLPSVWASFAAVDKPT
ncbi:MAG: aldo/keto reductase [Chloroflexi bacterium]|nr:aldo/keto reductase [Chloroflexota bacterium]